jgi:PKD repeat protein
VPVATSIGQIMSGNAGNTIGYLKGSPDGSKLALAVWYDNFFEMFDFDNSTGIVSHNIFLPSYGGASSGAYGVEFSPDGTRLYGTVITPGYIYQWDLTAGSDSLIQASKTLVGTSGANFNGALQLATDDKIYMAELGYSWLGVINDPNVLGTGCNYDDTGFQLTSGSNGIGLPNMYYCTSPSVSPPVANFIVSDTTICEKFCIDFFDSSSITAVSWLWNFPGGSPVSSTDQNPSNVCYDNPGVFDVTLIATDANGNSDTLTLPDYITVYTNPFVPVITQTGNVLSCSPAGSYQWQLNLVDIPGATNQLYTILQSGLYTVIIGDENGCTAQASFDAFLVGISEMDENSFVNIFPNPSSGSFTIEFSASEDGWLEIKVVNTIGQIIFSATDKISSPSFSEGVHSDKKEIDLGNIAVGIYFIEIKGEHEFFRKKILISH